jgi:hypothetical protein
MDRERIVRLAIDRFSNKDFAGAVKFLDPDARVSDLLRPRNVMLGRDAVLLQWIRRFDEGRAEAYVADVVGVEESALAAVCFQAYTADATAFGPPFIVASRFTFEEDRITGLTHTPFNEVPEDVKALFHVY